MTAERYTTAIEAKMARALIAVSGGEVGGMMHAQEQRETAATQVVERRARIMGASKYAMAWGCLGARNAVKAGESCHRAIEVGTARVVDIMESNNAS